LPSRQPCYRRIPQMIEERFSKNPLFFRHGIRYVLLPGLR